MEYIARYIKNSERKQTIEKHLNNVSECTSTALASLHLTNLGKICGLLHDMGKFSPEFQTYIRQEEKYAKGSVNHSAAGASYIYQKFYQTAESIWEKLTAQLLCNAICSHHSGLLDCIKPEAGGVPVNAFLQRVKPDMDLTEIAGNFCRNVRSETAVEQMFSRAVLEVKNFFIKNISEFHIGMLQKVLFSALIDSDRYDAYCFEAGLDIKKEVVLSNRRYKTSNGQVKEHLTVWDEAVEKLEERLQDFGQDSELNKIRAEISQECLNFAKRRGGVYRLCVPTGGGKTLSSFRFAINFAKEHEEIQHIYYVIPYTSIIDQTADEVRKVCGEEMVLEHHSGVVQEDEAYELLTQRWTAPIILTTLVQFMNSIYSHKSACARRMHALCHSVIIVDEVQAIPKKLLHLFNEAVNFLSRFCGTTVVLCSATQPSFALTEHKLHLSEECDMVSKRLQNMSVFNRTRVVNLSGKPMTCREIGEFAMEQIDKKPSLLVVCNTKKTAKMIYDAIENKGKKMLLTTNFCREHRSKMIQDIREKTSYLAENGAETPLDERLIVVSTQLIEAGVDLSFACAIRVMAGVDSIVQTAGRCGRNGEFGQNCAVYLVACTEENLSHLKEIEEAQRVTKQILSYDNEIDLLSESAIEKYYQLYLKENDWQYSELDYIIRKPIKTTLMDLLSKNQKVTSDFVHMTSMPLPIIRQSFQTAGENFHVIDSANYSVIVSYGKGKEIVEKLTSGCGIKEKTALLKRSQAYTVNLFEWEKKLLEKAGALYLIEDAGVLVLAEAYYDEEFGVVFDAELDFLTC